MRTKIYTKHTERGQRRFVSTKVYTKHDRTRLETNHAYEQFIPSILQTLQLILLILMSFIINITKLESLNVKESHTQ